VRLLEYESKKILEKYKIPIPQGKLAESSDGIHMDSPVMIKAQIPVGGRYKAGGILTASTNEEAERAFQRLLSSKIQGYTVRKILVEEQFEI